MKSSSRHAAPTDFFDWDYAKKVWFAMDTRAALEAEWNKYAGDFEPWLESYKKNPQKALQELKGYSKDRRLNIKHGHDIQLAWEEWWDHSYSYWFRIYRNNGTSATFEDIMANSRKSSCEPFAYLGECGHIPDWREKLNLAKEQKIAERLAAERAARERRAN